MGEGMKAVDNALIGLIGDEDTVTGFLLGGIGNVDIRKNTNYLVVDSKTTPKVIDDTFKEMTTRNDIGIVLITQTCAEQIRHTVNNFSKPIPAILEIPSKDSPYDVTKDGILSKVKHLVGGEGGQ